jgi:hypothetical protein
MLITFAQFETKVKEVALAEGEAENLSIPHRNYVVNALITCQTWVKCLRDFHIDYFTHPDVFDACDVAYVTGPRGAIRRVWAFRPEIECKRYPYAPQLMPEIEAWIQKKQQAGTAILTDNKVNHADWCYEYYTSLGLDEDDTCWKGEYKFYAKGPGCKLVLAPRFPCGYVLGIQWSGIKRSWADDDLILDDQDLVDAAALYLEGERALRLDHDRDKHANIMGPEGDGIGGRFGGAIADMIKRCKEEMRVPQTEDYYDELINEADAMYDPVPDNAPPSTTSDSCYYDTTLGPCYPKCP